MSKSAMVAILALLSTAAAEPLVFSTSLVPSPYISGYNYLSPAASIVAAPVGPAVSALPAAPLLAAPVSPAVGAIPAAVPATYPAAVPYSSVSAYSYGSSYSVQDYLPTVVNPSPSLAYSLPYAYAADYYYRQ